MYDFIIKYMDEDPEYTAIIERCRREAEARASPEETIAILDLSGCSEHEKQVIEEHNKRMVDRSIRMMRKNQGEDYSSDIISTSLSPPAVGQPVDNYVVARQLRAMTATPASKADVKSTPYDLMWKFLSVIPLRRYQGEFYRPEGNVFIKVSDEELNELISWVLEVEIATGRGPQMISDTVKMLTSYHRIKIMQTTDTSARFFFLNGAYCVWNNTLEPVKMNEDFFTSYITCSYPTGDVDCPVFDGFLESISGGDQSIEQAIWEMIGYLLVPYDLNGKVFFILQGVGNTGKSVLGNLIASYFNPESVSYLDIFRFKDRFSTSSLVGKRLNMSMDLPRDNLSKEAIGNIKQITGNDTITVEAKYKEARPYKPTCKLLFGTNFPLLVADNDDAFRQRVVVIPFQYPVSEEAQDKHLLEKLMLERPAIAAKALDAYRNLVSRNYQFIRPTGGVVFGCPPMADVLLSFVNDCCQFNGNSYTSIIELHQAFIGYCMKKGLPRIDDRTSFSRQLNALCGGKIQHHKRRVNGVSTNCYDGISLEAGNGYNV